MVNNKTINIIYTVLLFIKMNLTDEKSVFFMPFFKNKGGNKMEKEILKLLGYTLADTTSKTIYEILAERGIEGKIKGR